MKTLALKTWLIVLALLFYDFAVGGIHLALISFLTPHLYWSAYWYLEHGVLNFDAYTQITGMAIVMISCIEFFKKFIAVFNRLIQAREHLAR